MTGADGTVLWSHQADNPGELPGANLIFDALDAVKA
jgi:peroxiredoxin (alkyl hydroperoxide reductase subunit C)